MKNFSDRGITQAPCVTADHVAAYIGEMANELARMANEARLGELAVALVEAARIAVRTPDAVESEAEPATADARSA